jgi:hypothetical protein
MWSYTPIIGRLSVSVKIALLTANTDKLGKRGLPF